MADAPAPLRPSEDGRATTVARLSSAALFGPRREIVICHGDAEYRLRITKANKLILTK
jgi:hemin uptake protein HemP